MIGKFNTIVLFFLMASALSVLAEERAPDASPPPTVTEFLGLNTHTVQFKPQNYEGIVKRLRDYHPVNWDLGDDTSVMPPWPRAKNGVNWQRVYGSWVEGGYEPNVCLMLARLPADKWRDMSRDAAVYASEFVQKFGPGGTWPYVTSVGLGNEPEHYSDENYLKVFDAMSQAIRKASPEMLITTCNVHAKPSGRYWKDINLFKDRLDQFDVITTHSYALVEGWPTWRRSYPEDPYIDFLKDIQAVLDWRDKHAPDKQVWINEYGWDASTRDAPKDGTFKDWVDVSDEQQAAYLVRATLIFMGMGLDRGYIFFFDDEDKPSVHASSGIMRHGKPKPAWYMLKQLQELLGDFIFVEAEKEKPKLYQYRFAKGDASEVATVVWSPTGEVIEYGPVMPMASEGGGLRIYELTGDASGPKPLEPGMLKVGMNPVVIIRPRVF